uniref:NEDD8-activating enzyme E1 catalytic subunit n=1 Tax=Oncorhynchus kisutch TaxID=8019 RepID=A0A8C7JXA9_ONCKI
NDFSLICAEEHRVFSVCRMAVDGDRRDWDGRWNHVKKFLERPGPFTHPDFEPSIESLGFLLETCKILVIGAGAGGLGCELLKNLALSGFRHIHVVDMDTIDISNLNRKNLLNESVLRVYWTKDVGQPKADVAADFVNGRVPGCQVNSILLFVDLDSIIARHWMNGMLVCLNINNMLFGLFVYVRVFSGFKRGLGGGMAGGINFPMCTIASMPRLPEHCVEYVRMLQWPKDKPFGDGVGLDGDNPEHIHWVFQRAQERAVDYSITGVTYRLTQDDKTHVLPAFSHTFSACSTEVFKIASSTYIPLNNYLVFNIVDGLYTYTFEAERKENCSACSQVPQDLQFPPSAKLQEVLEYLTENAPLQMKSPAITETLDGKNKTLYLQTIELAVADVTTPQTVLFWRHYRAVLIDQ